VFPLQLNVTEITSNEDTSNLRANVDKQFADLITCIKLYGSNESDDHQKGLKDTQLEGKRVPPIKGKIVPSLQSKGIATTFHEGSICLPANVGKQPIAQTWAPWNRAGHYFIS